LREIVPIFQSSLQKARADSGVAFATVRPQHSGFAGFELFGAVITVVLWRVEGAEVNPKARP
jgi:hypothetical protein